jgi:hypothetical protein
MTGVSRVWNLIRLAVDPAAAENEARTAALIACRTIVQQDLQIAFAGIQRVAAEPQVSRRIIRSKYPGVCIECLRPYAAGDPIAWAKEAATIHAQCWRRGCQ